MLNASQWVFHTSWGILRDISDLVCNGKAPAMRMYLILRGATAFVFRNGTVYWAPESGRDQGNQSSCHRFVEYCQ